MIPRVLVCQDEFARFVRASRVGEHASFELLVTHEAYEDAGVADRTAREEVEARMTAHFCVAMGGSCPPDGPSLEAAHWGTRVTDRDFDGFLAHLVAAMAALGIGEVEQNELLAVVGPLRARVVAPIR